MNSYKNFKQVFKRLVRLKFSTRQSSFLSISLLHGNNNSHSWKVNAEENHLPRRKGQVFRP